MVPVASVFFDPNNFDITKPGYGEGDQINSETFQNLSSAVELLPGYYSVVTFNDWNWNEYNPYPQTEGSPSITLNDGGGLITFDGSGRYDPTNSCQYFPGPGCSSSYFDFPTTVDSGPADRYMAGSFIFEDAKIPEPSTVGLICAGLAGVWVLRRRRA
jgi:hypothetical protein